MKGKIISLSLILIIVMTLVSNVYAVPTYKVNLNTDKNEYNINDEFEVDVVLLDIKDEKGIIALGAVLEYDKNSLELVKMEAQGDWVKPSYNEENGKFVTDRDNSYATEDETVLRIIFKVREESQKDITITLKNIVASNGNEDIKINNESKVITIKNSTEPDKKPEDNNGNDNNVDNNVGNNEGNNVGNNVGNNTGNNVGNNASNNNSVFNGKIPQAGENGTIIIFSIIVLIAIVATYFIKIKIINKKNREE